MLVVTYLPCYVVFKNRLALNVILESNTVTSRLTVVILFTGTHVPCGLLPVYVFNSKITLSANLSLKIT